MSESDIIIAPNDPAYMPKHGGRAKMANGIVSVDPKSSQDVTACIGIKMKHRDTGMEFTVQEGHTDVDAKLVAEALHVLVTHYPGYTWRVAVDDRPNVGMLDIYNEDVNDVLGNQQYGYRIYLKTAYNDPSLRCVLRAGGEILERASLSRGWSKGDIPNNIDGVKDKHQPQPWLIREREKELH